MLRIRLLTNPVLKNRQLTIRLLVNRLLTIHLLTLTLSRHAGPVGPALWEAPSLAQVFLQPQADQLQAVNATSSQGQPIPSSGYQPQSTQVGYCYYWYYYHAIMYFTLSTEFKLMHGCRLAVGRSRSQVNVALFIPANFSSCQCILSCPIRWVLVWSDCWPIFGRCIQSWCTRHSASTGMLY